MEIDMKKAFAIAAVLTLGAAGATAAELPAYEKDGFPITLHQLRVVGPAHVREQSPAPTLAGVPASPHQLTVLTPRSE
jgi:hypothetical protein